MAKSGGLLFGQLDDLNAIPNIKAYLLLIRHCEGTLNSQCVTSQAPSALVSGDIGNIGYYRLGNSGKQNYVSYTDLPITEWLAQGFPEKQVDDLYASGNTLSTAGGAYQFLESTWNDMKHYVPGIQNFMTSFGWRTIPFTPLYQDRWAIQLLNLRHCIDDIKKGDIYSAIQKTNATWVSLPCTKKKQGSRVPISLVDGLNFFKSAYPGATIDKTNQGYIDNNLVCSDVGNSDGTVADAAEQALLRKQLQINLNAIQNNVDMLQVQDTQVNWGARQSKAEQSDWIGLKQYILYLCTVYTPESIVPFVELIPRFLLDEPKESKQNKEEATDPSLQALIDQKRRFEKTTQQFLDLQKGNLGYGDKNNVTGIDLLTIDPFRELLTSGNESVDHAWKRLAGTGKDGTSGQTSMQRRNLGYRLFGNVVLSPDVMGDEMSKAGGIGFKSFEIQKGATVMQGVTNINIKIVDVQGNKFFDTASPWSFILNSSQIYGDFYFRYGWQLRIPDYNPKNGDKSSTEFKFWNHPGWNLFCDVSSADGTVNQDSVANKKEDVSSLVKKSGTNVLTLTQSSNLNSVYYPGYVISKDNSEVFTVDRRQLDPTNYLVISMITPEINVDSHSGAITASIQFRMNTALMTCMCPLTEAKNMKLLLAENTVTNLIPFMIAFLKDNKEHSTPTTGVQKTNSQQETNAIDNILTNNAKGSRRGNSDQFNCNFIVKKIQKGGDMSYGEIESQCTIKISQNRINEISGKGDWQGNNTVSLRAWVYEVLSDNHMTMVGAGDPGIGTQQNQSVFTILWDDTSSNANFQSFLKNGFNYTFNELDDNIFDNGTGFLGYSDIYSRIIMQDDVFSFRFRGSLIEELHIEGMSNPSAQNNNNILALAGKAVTADINGKAADNKTGAQVDIFGLLQDKLYDSANQQLVTYNDKNTWLGYLLTKMAGVTIKCIAHPWLRIGVSIYVKGNGYFDGKYIITKITHNLESDNKFTSTINGVRVFNDEEYANTQEAEKNSQRDKMNSSTDLAQRINKGLGGIQDVLKKIKNPPINPTPKNTKGR